MLVVIVMKTEKRNLESLAMIKLKKIIKQIKSTLENWGAAAAYAIRR